MIKADLHVHSTVSDGSYSIQKIVDKAVAKGLDVIALTDHDTLSQAEQIPESTPIRVIPGIEISAFDYVKNYRAHILGYGISDTGMVEKFVHPVLEARNANSLKQIAVLNENGFQIDVEKVKKADGKYIYKQHIMDYLLEEGRVSELFGDFYYQTFKNGGVCDFDIQYANPKDAVRTIKEAGGVAVLAHSGQQQNFDLIPDLVKCGLDGLEYNHHSHSAKDHCYIRAYADKYHLFLTGGSDCHGRYEAGSPDVGDYLSEQSGIQAIMSLLSMS